MEPRPMEFELAIEDQDPAELRVLSMTCREELSGSVRAAVEVLGPQLDLEAIIGKKASVIGRMGPDEPTRCWHGVVLDASIEALREQARLQVIVGARLELLKLGRDSRIFQEKSVQDIVCEVLDGAGLAGAYEWAVNAPPAVRKYVAQYAESDYDFIARLLHEEGIVHVVHNDEVEDKILFFDDPSALEPVPENHLLVDRDSAQMAEDVAFEIGIRHRAAPDQVSLRDYDYDRPAADLTVTKSAEQTTGREVYLHPGGYTETSVGNRLAQRILERLRAGTRAVQGGANLARLEPGRTFAIMGHDRAEIAEDLVVVAVTHRAYGAQAEDRAVTYENDFVAIPKEAPWRPAVTPPHPVVGGTHVAFVTTPPGGEIHTEELGRVKVRFPWDRSGITDDKSSTWMRVGQLALGGSMILPRLDFEVLVDFEVGDIDRPCVTGHLYNAEKMPPYGLPGDKTRSSVQSATTSGGPGANELRIEDSGGAEEIFLNASKDYTLSVENDASATVGVNETYKTGSNNVLSVGTDYGAAVGGDRSLSVGANQDINVGGNYAEGVGGDLSTTVGAMRMVKVGGDHVEKTTGDLSRTVGALQSVTGIKGFERKIVGSSTVTVGAAWCEIAGGSRLLSVKASFTETVGALKFIKAKSFAVSCGAAYAMTAGAEKIDCGGSRKDEAKGAVALTAGAPIKIKATSIVLEGSSKIVVRGGACSLELTSGGQVTIKAPSVTVKGAKALNQAMHKSN